MNWNPERTETEKERKWGSLPEVISQANEITMPVLTQIGLGEAGGEGMHREEAQMPGATIEELRPKSFGMHLALQDAVLLALQEGHKVRCST